MQQCLSEDSDPLAINNNGITPVNLLWNRGQCGDFKTPDIYFDRNMMAKYILLWTKSERRYGEKSISYHQYFETAKSGSIHEFEHYIILDFSEDLKDDNNDTAMHHAAKTCNKAVFEGMVNGAFNIHTVVSNDPGYLYWIPARVTNKDGQKPHQIAQNCTNIDTNIIETVKFQSR